MYKQCLSLKKKKTENLKKNRKKIGKEIFNSISV